MQRSIEKWATVMHIPHASRVIPDDIREQFVLNDHELELEQICMTDSYTDELFGGLEGCEDAVFPASRLVVDPERFDNDECEPLAKIGMGVVYQVTHDLQPLRRLLTAAERKHLLDTYYQPHHDKLTELVRPPKLWRGRAAPGSSLIIDAHSFPSRALPYETDASAGRPEICIGTDDEHTPDYLRDIAESLFSKAGFSVAVDTPFAGALVPDLFYKRDMRVCSIMIEVRRDLYMDEETGEKLVTFDVFREHLRELLGDLLFLYWRRVKEPSLRKHPDNDLGKHQSTS